MSSSYKTNQSSLPPQHLLQMTVSSPMDHSLKSIRFIIATNEKFTLKLFNRATMTQEMSRI